LEIASDGGTGSRLLLIQSGISHRMVEMGESGWGSTLDRLAKAIGIVSAA